MNSILSIVYILSVVSFIVGLRMMNQPSSSRAGNQWAGAGMIAAILATLLMYRNEAGQGLQNQIWIIGGLAVGTVIGLVVSKKIQMTAMPEMVSLLNGLGGASAALISIVELMKLAENGFIVGMTADTQSGVPAYVSGGTMSILFSGLILGGITFSGSMVAWGKLSGRINDFGFKGQHIINLIILATSILISAWMTINIETTPAYWIIVIAILGLLYGVFFTTPVGGADMPVVISLLNSFSGLSAATSGFLYDNKVILVGGILVGAAGTILTVLMCKAMNRSLINVLMGSFGGSSADAGPGAQGTVKEISKSDAAVVLSYAQKVIIVPGYGLAVAQAQHACHELEKLLEAKGVQVTYAIHPVAGRMPGHMNVLLAEADVSYDNLIEMDQANKDFESTDVVLIMGANDVVNPAAKTNPSSPIYGMPILDVSTAKTIFVNKRSMKPGYAGIENELFFHPKTSMIFGDGKKMLQELINEVRNLD
ncbi:MAG: NAD(P)(+) transhydrogenase (Re/Si-specific) subunit beta [Saprospiraceae bacterium]|nr:NAD(P)(+) transhydrogenase (Re/Si-specific) subunit beta [Saprospiraceae bacterium]